MKFYQSLDWWRVNRTLGMYHVFHSFFIIYWRNSLLKWSIQTLCISFISLNLTRIIPLVRYAFAISITQYAYKVIFYILAAFIVSFFQHAVLLFFYLVIQHMNYRLLGFRLYERKPPVDIFNAVLDEVIQVKREEKEYLSNIIFMLI